MNNGRRPPPGFPEILAAAGGAATVLDVGCGSGRLAVELALAGAAVTGIDVSERGSPPPASAPAGRGPTFACSTPT